MWEGVALPHPARPGHTVNPLRIEPGLLIADFLVDVPPYRFDPSLQPQREQYVCTSVGIVVRRGR